MNSRKMKKGSGSQNNFGMNVNRIRHLENAMCHFELNSLKSDAACSSIDSHLRSYFRAHKKKIRQIDKEWIWDKFKDVYRWRGLLQHFSKHSSSSTDLLRVYFGNSNWRAYSDSKTTDDHVKVSMPTDLLSRLSLHFGKAKAQEIGRVWNEPCPSFLRVNVLKSSREAVMKELSGRGVSVEETKVSDIGLRLNKTETTGTIPELRDHICSPQDESSQIVGLQVDAQEGQKVLDYCAGSGGKSLVFGPKLGGKGHLFLYDINPVFLKQASRKLRDAGIRNFTCLESEPRNLGSNMDWVLIDPPTTGSGQFRRYPDRKWLYSDAFLKESVVLQRQIFESGLRYLKRGGKIVYATGSIMPEENEEQVKYFCDKHKLYLVKEPVYALPQSHGMDGFFCAILEHQ
jgi:16S rRNA (cytosine967-C5)-methyltransferase